MLIYLHLSSLTAWAPCKHNKYVFIFNTHTNKTIYQQIYFQFIIKVFLLFCFAQDRLKVMKSQRFVLRRCLKNLTMGNPIKHSEHLFYAG